MADKRVQQIVSAADSSFVGVYGIISFVHGSYAQKNTGCNFDLCMLTCMTETRRKAGCVASVAGGTMAPAQK